MLPTDISKISQNNQIITEFMTEGKLRKISPILVTSGGLFIYRICIFTLGGCRRAVRVFRGGHGLRGFRANKEMMPIPRNFRHAHSLLKHQLLLQIITSPLGPTGTCEYLH